MLKFIFTAPLLSSYDPKSNYREKLKKRLYCVFAHRLINIKNTASVKDLVPIYYSHNLRSTLKTNALALFLLFQRQVISPFVSA